MSQNIETSRGFFYATIVAGKWGVAMSGKTDGKKTGKYPEKVRIKALTMLETGMTVREIFAAYGEPHFRALETETVRELSRSTDYVIATGGGAVLKKENVNYLRSNGKIFFLNRPIADILPTDDRPLSRNRTDLQKRFDERYPIYQETADEEIFVDGKVENAVRRIEETL